MIKQIVLGAGGPVGTSTSGSGARQPVEGGGHLATGRPSGGDGDGRWRAWCSALVPSGPAAVRPRWATANRVRPDLDGSPPRHDLLGCEWFDDVEHWARAVRWWGTEQGTAVWAARAAVLGGRLVVLVAEEQVVRGASWLEQRWRDGGRRVKHMALAHLAEGVDPAVLRERWQRRAGTVTDAGGSTVVIPERVRGQAYVQNIVRHDLHGPGGWPGGRDRGAPRAGGAIADGPVAEGAVADGAMADGAIDYDAINEVWFDDEDALRSRVAWFAATAAGADDDLFGDRWLMAVEEVVVPGA